MAMSPVLTLEELKSSIERLEKQRFYIPSVQGCLANIHRTFCSGKISHEQYKDLIDEVKEKTNLI